jgi:PAS domain S-box-containing protein
VASSVLSRAARDAAFRGLRELLWPAPTPALLESAEGRVLDLNAAAEALFAHHGRPLVGRETAALLPEAHRAAGIEARLARNRAAREGGVVAPLRLRIDAADGQPRWFAGVPHNVGGRGADGSLDAPRWLFLLQDVTDAVQARREKERAEAERDRAHHQVATAMAGASIVVATYDAVHGWQLPVPAVREAAQTASALGAMVAGVRAEYVRPGMRAEYERLQHALRHAEAADVRFALDHPQLGERWLQVHVAPLPEAEGRAVSVAMVDVTERERAQQALALQADRTRAVLDSVLVGIVTVGEAGIVWLNQSARRMFGGHMADFIGREMSIVASPEPDHPLRRGDWLQRLTEGQGESFECRLQALDGRSFWVAGNAVLTHDGDGGGGAARHVTFALLDIERRRQSETRIAAARGRLQRLIETAPLAIVLFDPQTLRVQQANAQAAAFFARSPLPGLMPEECADPAQAQALRGWLEQVRGAANEAPSLVQEWSVEREGGPATVWDCRIARLAAEDDGGERSGAAAGSDRGMSAAEGVLLLVASDVTAQRSAEQARLAAAIAQREALVREVHHRIKNNLQGVAGLLQHNAREHPEVATQLLEATSQVQAIAQVYGLQLGRRGALPVAQLLAALVVGVERSFGQSLPPPEVAPGLGDAVLPEPEAIPLALVVNELLGNALRHGTPGSARVHLDRADADTASPGVAIRVVSEGRLPVGFDLAAIRSGVSGLGLVRALVPRRGAAFTLAQQGAQVCAEVRLVPPRIAWLEPAAAAPPADPAQPPR